ncbi:hypothetical protein RJ45_22745 [Photobacterium gaetbulicola]|uniref:Helix-hairpin-helix DNA-binding motif class 1 domain-containing protein n=1 Tax=Photobacterium gaetbulicola TaxID=1295392 RepID=A0A0B9FY33_9GAMM|nr:helix-hairpin-helix domain-containing protein [Photobacterium gaetbulicola]KHT61473.1 hypothetical protein RJ45_22745 [Photobacterium gaetbulicola]
MGLFDFIFDKSKKEPTQNQKPVEPEVKQAPKHYQDIVSDNTDICEGMIFHPTCQLRTPLFVLKKCGEVFHGDSEPPTYGEPKDGIWLPKLSSDFDFLDQGSTTASDAGQVNQDEYINYAVGLLSIFDSDKPIENKMAEALSYAGDDESLKRIESGILSHYAEQNIADVMARFVSNKERKEYYFDKPNRLTLVDGVNKKIAQSLEANGIQTAKELSKLTEDELLKINGIGRVSAKNIVSYLS